jgi:hypothetical protein
MYILSTYLSITGLTTVCMACTCMGMTKRTTKRKVRKQAPTIVVDGVTYKIPPMMRDCPDEVIIRTIRAWKGEPKPAVDWKPDTIEH